MKSIIALLGAVVFFALYVRFAPSKSTLWHQPVEDIVAKPMGSFSTTVAGADFAVLHQIISATPRTSMLAGDPVAQFVTYVTRSKLWGFPDYTTVEQLGSEITLLGRSRFGRKDLGVNKARIKGWIAALEEVRG